MRGIQRNRWMAMDYMRKQELLGIKQMGFKFKGIDSVELDWVEDGRSIVIPSFVNRIRDGVFEGKHYNKIVIKGKVKNLSLLCFKLESDYVEVEIKQGEYVRDTSNMFRNCELLKGIKIKGLECSRIKNVSNMFSWCTGLSGIDIRDINMGYVRNMNGMFSGSGIKQIELRGIDTSKVKDIGNIFSWCSELEEVDISGLDTRNVRNMSNMFSLCESLKEIDISNFDTSRVINMSCMFMDCYKLKSVVLGEFDVRKVRKMVLMFNWCKSLVDIDMSKFSSNGLRGRCEMSYIFEGCDRLYDRICKEFKIYV